MTHFYIFGMYFYYSGKPKTPMKRELIKIRQLFENKMTSKISKKSTLFNAKSKTVNPRFVVPKRQPNFTLKSVRPFLIAMGLFIGLNFLFIVSPQLISGYVNEIFGQLMGAKLVIKFGLSILYCLIFCSPMVKLPSFPL